MMRTRAAASPAGTQALVMHHRQTCARAFVSLLLSYHLRALATSTRTQDSSYNFHDIIFVLHELRNAVCNSLSERGAEAATGRDGGAPRGWTGHETGAGSLLERARGTGPRDWSSLRASVRR